MTEMLIRWACFS